MNNDLLYRHLILYIPTFALSTYLMSYVIVSTSAPVSILVPLLLSIALFFVARAFGADEPRALSLAIAAYLSAVLAPFLSLPLWSTIFIMPLLYLAYRALVRFAES